MKLSQKQVKHLKALAHSFKPVVRVGQHGVTPAVVRELDLALAHHELLKIKVSVGERELRAQFIESLCQQTEASCVQSIGNVAVLFRRNAKLPVVTLPN